jgi:transposase
MGAVEYEALIRCCEDANLEIHSNRAGRSLRATGVGQRDWLFFGSDDGWRTSATFTSSVATYSQLLDNFFIYLGAVSHRISGRGVSCLEELLPDNWQAAQTATPKLLP